MKTVDDSEGESRAGEWLTKLIDFAGEAFQGVKKIGYRLGRVFVSMLKPFCQIEEG